MTSAILGVVAVLATISVACPNGYSNLFEDKCYKITMNQMNWKEASALCHNEHAELVSIHSQEENEAIHAAMPGCCAYWIGLRCEANVSNKKRYWTDRTPIDYINRVDGLKDLCGPTEGYFISQSNGGWVFTALTDPSIYAICATTGVPLLGVGTECGLGYTRLNDDLGTCVRISDKSMTWQEAEEDCQVDGAHLAVIHSKEANDHIRRSALALRLSNAIFIGFTFNHTVTDLSWSDGTGLDYSNFDAGMPNSLFGNCGAMQTGHLGGAWTSAFCDNSTKLPFACTKPQPCPSLNVFTESGEFASPEYPSSRSSGLSCEYLLAASSGSLVSLSFDEFQLVDGDQVILYEGEGTGEPLAVITSAASTDRFTTKAANVMRLVHLAGTASGNRTWHANFVSV